MNFSQFRKAIVVAMAMSAMSGRVYAADNSSAQSGEPGIGEPCGYGQDEDRKFVIHPGAGLCADDL